MRRGILPKRKFPIQVKRIYESPSLDDGFRILVDRPWPRGIKKEQAKIGLWLKEIAPSDSLRKWFNHEPEKWEEFKRRYFKELEQMRDLVDQLIQHTRKGKVTFLFSAKDETHNNAIALREYLLGCS
jgi:uncharacterized protein YeaO (DUF488 family)